VAPIRILERFTFCIKISRRTPNSNENDQLGDKMTEGDHINIYEYFDPTGDPSHYICNGHVDSEQFRDECFKEYSIRPLVIRHGWQQTKRTVLRESKKKRALSRIDSVRCSSATRNATAVTIGLVPRDERDQNLSDFDIN
jgi:hypothetical protein